MADDPTNTVVPQSAPIPDRLLPGMIVGEYVIEAAIAAGGCGTVYKAKHRVLGRSAAIKVLSRDLADSREMLSRFEREAKAVNKIQHPNIVDVFGFGKIADGRPFYVMELLEGTSLGELIKRRGRFTPAEALEILEPVCAALQAAHDAGIVHRDLKGGNVMVATKGDQKLVKLLDFGIAKLIHPEPGEAGLTTAGRRLGTPSAMAPEQFRGDPVDARTDIYALGVLLYRLLTGQLPFQGASSLEIELAHLNAPAPPPSRIAPISPAMDAIVLRCLEKLPEHRFPSARAFASALREAAVGQDTHPSGPKVIAMEAVAVYVEARAAEGAEHEPDDAFLDDLTNVLDTAEQALRSAGFLIPLQTGSAVLGALLLSDDSEQSRVERHRAVNAAILLYRALSERPMANPRVHVNVCMHADKALMRSSHQGPEIVGGALLSTGAWVPSENLHGLCVTRSVCEGLSELAGAPALGKYVKIS